MKSDMSSLSPEEDIKTPKRNNETQSDKEKPFWSTSGENQRTIGVSPATSSIATPTASESLAVVADRDSPTSKSKLKLYKASYIFIVISFILTLRFN